MANPEPSPVKPAQRSTGGGSTVAVSRPLVGALALGCLLIATAIWALGSMDSKSEMWMSAFARVGLLMSAFWLALPTRNREAAWANMSPWTLVGALLAILVVAYRPRVLWPLAVVLGTIGYFLRPRPKKRPARQPGVR